MRTTRDDSSDYKVGSRNYNKISSEKTGDLQRISQIRLLNNVR